MEQQARYVTMEECGFLSQSRYLLHDRDSKFSLLFEEVIEAGGEAIGTNLAFPRMLTHSRCCLAEILNLRIPDRLLV
jgi:hypothetical protein